MNEVITEPYLVFLRRHTGADPSPPAVNATTAQVITAGWAALGRQNRGSFKREGVKVAHSSSFNEFMGANDTDPTHRWLTEQSAEISVSVVDSRLETIALQFDQAVVAAGNNPETTTVGLSRLPDVWEWSLLIRGRTPYSREAANDKWRQLVYWLCHITSGYEEQPNRDNPGEIPFVFKPLARPLQTPAKRYGEMSAWSG